MPGKNDFILASFPKSGNTWVSFLIANIYNEISGKFDEVDFHNIHEFHPELRNIDKHKSILPGLPQVILSHSQFKRPFKNVILMLRDPWDVMLSYHQYLNGERLKRLSLSEVITHNRYGIRALVKHNNSFIRNCKNILMVSYERLHDDPLREVGRLISFLGLEVDNDIIRASIRKSDFKSMREVELRKGRKFGTPGFVFTRKGEVGEGRQIIGEIEDMNSYISENISNSPVLSFLYL